MNRSALFLLIFVCTNTFAQTVTRIPYLQKPSSTGITVRWRTDQSVKGKVIYKKEGESQSLSVLEDVPVFNHEIELKGLEPDTKYSYQIATESRVQNDSEKLFFTTLPSKEAPKPIRIWAMGDFGDFTKKSYIDNQNAVYSSFKKFNKDQPVDLWMWLGDNAYCCGSDNQYQTGVFEYFSPDFFAQTPIVSIPGNHEYYFATGSEATRQIPYFDLISVHTEGEAGGVPSGNKAYYSFDVGNIHFIALDSYGLDDGKKLYDWESPQYQWLLRDLEENSKKGNMWTVVYLHHPPYTKRSHDSDTEQDLVKVRAYLVHKFDEYKVDLVLSGHSHVYERSYLIRGHSDKSETFDPVKHIVQNTKAHYTADSPPIINKDSGTLYAVVGSAGRLDWNGKSDPHPTSVYSNKDLGGSLLLTIDDNRLDGQWMCADGTIKDNFTMFKNVNISKTIDAIYGDEIELTASWPSGTYLWSSGERNQRTLEHKVLGEASFMVMDSLGYLKEVFTINAVAKPTVVPILKTNSTVCAGGGISGYFEITNASATGWSYKLLLSDKNGSFNNAVEIGSISSSDFLLNLPENTEPGNQYKLKAVVSENPNFESLESATFSISKPASARLLQEGTIPYTSEVELSVSIKGALPAFLKISTLNEMEIKTPEISVKVNPKGGSRYFIESIKNSCGAGEVLGGGLIVEQPLGSESELKGIKVYPNPGNGKFEVESYASVKNPLLLEVIDVIGKVVFRKTLTSIREKLELETLTDGLYIFKVSQGNQRASIKVVKN
jgi:hypothetical protein